MVKIDESGAVLTSPLDAPIREMVAIDDAVVVATDLGTVGLRLSHVEAQS